MSQRARTIQIYLPSGDPRGIRIAALTTSIVQVVEIPRALLPQFQQMSESSQVGVYLLVGDEDDGDQRRVYIGQTGALGKRLNEHHLDSKKDYWNRALVIVSLTRSLTQTHALYLEWQSISQANAAGRFKVENGNAGTKPHTPPPLEADCEEIFDQMRMLVATMGQPMFEPLSLGKEAAPAQDIFFCKGAAYDGVAEYTEEGVVVLKGSKARADMAPSLLKLGPGKKRQALIDDGRLKREGDQFVFQENVLFGSPSGASDVIVGTSTNGWLMWKDKSGRTLDELKRQNASSA